MNKYKKKTEDHYQHRQQETHWYEAMGAKGVRFMSSPCAPLKAVLAHVSQKQTKKHFLGDDDLCGNSITEYGGLTCISIPCYQFFFLINRWKCLSQESSSPRQTCSILMAVLFLTMEFQLADGINLSFMIQLYDSLKDKGDCIILHLKQHISIAKARKTSLICLFSCFKDIQCCRNQGMDERNSENALAFITNLSTH